MEGGEFYRTKLGNIKYDQDMKNRDMKKGDTLWEYREEGQEWSICKGPEAGVGFPGAQMVKNLPARQETLVRSLGWKYPLEKGTATHSCILAWRSPQTEEPGGLWSVGLQTVGHD